MTTIHVQRVGDTAVLSRAELERLLELARRIEPVELSCDDEMTTQDITRLAEQGGAFDWLADEEELYSPADLKVRYR
jgi:hypothetical protein